MKAIIITEGGSSIGFGHLTRCISLYQALSAKGLKSSFLIKYDKSAMAFLKKHDVRFDTYANLNFSDKLSSFDIAVIDSYRLNKIAYEKISKAVKLVLSIDDFNRLDYPNGLVLNSSFYAKELPYKRGRGIKYLLGPKYTLLRKEFRRMPRKLIDKNIGKVLITFGGKKYSKFTNKLINLLIKHFCFDIHLVLSGRDKKFLHITEKAMSRLYMYEGIGSKEMKRLMLTSDLCICGGGQTTNEVMACGIPAICVCFADNQIFNLKALSKAKLIDCAGWYNKSGIYRKIIKSIYGFTYSKRARASALQKKAIDDQGAKRILKKIITNLVNA